MRTARKWYHCRSCGEEALDADEERCPHCGILRPVILCDRCGRPVQNGLPWVLRRYWADRSDEPERELTLHRGCYFYQRWLSDSNGYHSGTALITKPDPRDRLTFVRVLIGVAILLSILLLFAGFLQYAPRPKEGTFSPSVLKPFIKHPEYNQPTPLE